MSTLQTLRQLESQTQRNFAFLFTVGLLFWIGLTTLLPTLPVYAQDIGASRQEVGFVMGAFAIGLLGSRVWLGQLVDRRGRKIAILIGTFVGATAPLGYLLTQSVLPLMAMRAYHGISVAAFATGYSALVVDLAPFKQRGELVGYMSLAVPVGMALGPALGGYCVEWAGYTTLFVLAAGLGLLSFLCTLPIQEHSPTRLESDAHLQSPSRTIWQLLTSPSLLVPSLVLLLVGFVFGNLATFLPLFIREIQLNLNTGLFYSTAAVASFISRVWTGRASDFYGRGVFITGSLLAYLASMLILSGVSTINWFLLAAILEGIGGGILIPMTIALISDRSSAQERGRVFAVCVSGFDVGIALAGPAFGYVEEFTGFRGLFLITSSLAFLAIILFLLQSNPDLKRSVAFALGRGRDDYALSK
ncbi:MFS transporter [Synechocystis sp. LKSZ1]|uniref:MFS transporter n=1 Tax=Synechocystis sp. LKSZ1 TaxID=3144951 RepID=UPI00336BB782